MPNNLDTIEFVNADYIAKGISPFNPSSVDRLAARVMLQRINELRKEQKSFAIETTLTTKSYASLFNSMQKEEYIIVLIFLWLENVELCIQRVAERVKEGGNNIHEDVIRRRYSKGISNLEKIFIPIADSWQIYDNTNGELQPIAEGGKRIATLVFNNEICKSILEQTI